MTTGSPGRGEPPGADAGGKTGAMARDLLAAADGAARCVILPPETAAAALAAALRGSPPATDDTFEVIEVAGADGTPESAWSAGARLARAAADRAFPVIVLPAAPVRDRASRAETVLVVIGRHASVGLAEPRAAGASEGDRRMLISFMEIAAASAGADDLDGVLETISGALGRLFPVDGASLALLDDGGIMVREILRRGGAARREPERLPADGSHMMSWVVRNGRPLWRNDISAELRFAESLGDSRLRSDMVIPLRARGSVIGAFQVGCRRPHAFDVEDFEVFKRCADLTAVAVETQRLLLATKRLAEIDGVTGVFNHRYFAALVRQEVERARRVGRPLALFMVDIDHFKRFNDTYGHQTGDEVLRHVAQVVARTLRRSDVVARYGGEEFAAILQDTDAAAALVVAEKVRAEVERASLGVPAGAGSLQVTVSLGVAVYPAEARHAGELVAAADRALYAAKRAGRNRVCGAAPESPAA